MASQITLTALTGLPAIAAGAPLAELIFAAAQADGLQFQDHDILVVAQKIVSKVEGRLVRLQDVSPGARAQALAASTGKDPRLVELILSESRDIVRTRPGLIIVEHRLGFVMANAGIDASNVGRAPEEACVLLLPADPDASAARLRTAIRALSACDVGVVIADSFGRAWRIGTTGTALGVAGLPAVIDMRGKADRDGRTLQVTEIGAADEVAAAASLLMGQADESRPVVHLRGFPYPLREGSVRELLRPRDQDMFR
jgi:coenzyme F420-0:L-glutamate ligase/coenzyme F420-1:gamma-L-glutamate ligase